MYLIEKEKKKSLGVVSFSLSLFAVNHVSTADAKRKKKRIQQNLFDTNVCINNTAQPYSLALESIFFIRLLLFRLLFVISFVCEAIFFSLFLQFIHFTESNVHIRVKKSIHSHFSERMLEAISFRFFFFFFFPF